MGAGRFLDDDMTDTTRLMPDRAGRIATIRIEVFADGQLAWRTKHGGRFYSCGMKTDRNSVLAKALPVEIDEAMAKFRQSIRALLPDGASGKTE